jgi:peptidoglycan hydrolase CwlO-like protein
MPLNIYATVKQALQDVVAPELKILQGRLNELQVEIKRLDEKIEALDRRISGQITDLQHQMRTMREDFHLAIDLHERIAALEAKIVGR